MIKIICILVLWFAFSGAVMGCITPPTIPINSGTLKSDIMNKEHSGYIHGLSESRVYWVWATLKQRCDNPNNIRYPSYGGRGITYITEWYDFLPFYNYVSKLPLFDKIDEFDLSIDRIDNDGNYEPGNVRWATRQQQELNKGLSIRNNSGALGVGWMPHINKWRARFKDVHIGTFADKQDAIKARFNYLKDNNYG